VVSATNASGLTTSETFAVQTPAPSPPMVTNQTGTQCCGAGEVNFTLAADTFTDPSGGPWPTRQPFPMRRRCRLG
jgi:hypothetical protein